MCEQTLLEPGFSPHSMSLCSRRLLTTEGDRGLLTLRGQMDTSGLVLVPVFRAGPISSNYNSWLLRLLPLPGGRPRTVTCFLSPVKTPQPGVCQIHILSCSPFVPKECLAVTLLDMQTLQESIAMNTCIKAATCVLP